MQSLSDPPLPSVETLSGPPTCSSNLPSCCNPWQRRNEENGIADPRLGNDTEIGQEMYSLTAEQRARIYDELHCVAQVHEETEEFVEKSLVDFDTCLSNVAAKKKKNLSRAFFLRPKLETDRKFRLKFLRADEFDAEKAVTRMIKHFDLKREIFGEVKLAKKITIDDLSEADLQVFRAGYVVELPEKDQIDRPVICADSTKLNFGYMTVENILRCHWYMVQASVETEAAQKKGVCCLCYSPGRDFSMSDVLKGKIAAIAGRGAYLISCMPIRYSSFHFCYDDPHMEFLIQALRLVASQNDRLRLRAHFGTELENEYKLMTFGIRASAVLRRAAEGDTSIHQDYIQRRREIDEHRDLIERQDETITGVAACPKASDVLIGRGYGFRGFPGNSAWSQLLTDYLHQYLQSNHCFEKTIVTTEVVNKIRQGTKGRFLHRTNEGWKIMDDAWARKKTAAAFRNRAKEMSSTSASTTTTIRATSSASIRLRAEDSEPQFQKDAKRARLDAWVAESS